MLFSSFEFVPILCLADVPRAAASAASRHHGGWHISGNR
jgi:hypothetical protein